MATPKGMRAIQVSVNATDAVHLYSNGQHVWLQIRRSVPTECDIGKPSFKVATCLTPSAARKPGIELLNAAENGTSRRQPSKGSVRAPDHPVGDATE